MYIRRTLHTTTWHISISSEKEPSSQPTKVCPTTTTNSTVALRHSSSTLALPSSLLVEHAFSGEAKFAASNTTNFQSNSLTNLSLIIISSREKVNQNEALFTRKRCTLNGIQLKVHLMEIELKYFKMAFGKLTNFVLYQYNSTLHTISKNLKCGNIWMRNNKSLKAKLFFRDQFVKCQH